MSEKSTHVVAIHLLCLCFSILACFVSNNLGPRFVHREETIRGQNAILDRELFLRDGESMLLPEFRNRILFPITLRLFSRSKLFEEGEWYLILQMLSAYFACLSFFYLFWPSDLQGLKVGICGLGSLAYGLIFSFNHGWEVPSDFIDVIFMSLILFYCLKRKRWAVYLLTLVGTLNRESTAFSGIIWFVLYGMDRKQIPIKECIFSLFLSVSGYLLALFMRSFLSVEGAVISGNSVVLIYNIRYFLEYFAHPTPTGWVPALLAMFALPLGWIFMNRRGILDVHKRLFAGIFMMSVITLIFGKINELRIFIPSFVVLTYCAVHLELTAIKALPKAPSNMIGGELDR